MAVVLFHSAEAWLLMASSCGRLLLLGAVRLNFIWDFLDDTVSMTPGGSVSVLHLFSPLSFLFQTTSTLVTSWAGLLIWVFQDALRALFKGRGTYRAFLSDFGSSLRHI